MLLVLEQVEDDEAILAYGVHYNKLRVEMDQFILQVMTDLKYKNKKKLYSQIDQSFKNNSSVTDPSAYVKVLGGIESDFELLMKTDGETSFAPTEVMGVIDKVSTLITSARDFRGKKIEAICEVLDKLRLRDLHDLNKKGNDDEKAKG